MKEDGGCVVVQDVSFLDPRVVSPDGFRSPERSTLKFCNDAVPTSPRGSR